MKLLIDIGHPAHVHYFRNFYKQMVKNGHNILVTARRKEVSHELLKSYNISYISRGSGGNSFVGKLFYLPKANYVLFKEAIRFKPDMFLSFSSPYAAQVSTILGKPHIAIDDTDIASYGHKVYVPFTDCIISPKGFKKNFGNKHLLIDSVFDLFYLASNCFVPDGSVQETLIKDNSKKTVFFRFTSMAANHDWKYKHLASYAKSDLIDIFKDKYNIIISSEDELPKHLMQYKFTLHPAKIHDALYYSDLFIGESGAMSTEAAILGVPSINMTASAAEVGVFKQLIDLEMMYLIQNPQDVIDKADKILSKEDSKKVAKQKADAFVASKVDITGFLVWFVENYPASFRETQKHPEIQYKFKN